MRRQARSTARDRQPENSSFPIIVILSLAIGLPALLALVIAALFVLFGFAMVKTREAVNAEIERGELHRQKEIGQGPAEKIPDQRFDPDPVIAPGARKPREANGPVPGAIAQPPAPPGVPGKKMVDLVPLIDPQIDAIEERRWSVINNVLHCPDAHFVPRIQIPYRPPPEYDFIVTFSQPELRNGISMIMPNPNGGSFYWFLGRADGREYGLGSDPDIAAQVVGLVQVNRPCTTVVQVRKSSVRCLVDGVERLHRKTDYREFRCDNWREIRDTRQLAVACDDPTVFHYVRVVEITGTGTRTR